jgi:thiosulfate dehydrogenase [quinone] large subunit
LLSDFRTIDTSHAKEETSLTLIVAQICARPNLGDRAGDGALNERTWQVALAGLRVYVGLVWFTYGRSKLEPNWAGGTHEFLSAVTDAAASTTEPFKTFLTGVVVPHQLVFAELVAYGELLVGIALILGLLTKVGALGGVFLSLNYLFETGKFERHFGLMSFELMLAAVSLFILVTPANRFASVDAVLRRPLRPRGRTTGGAERR